MYFDTFPTLESWDDNDASIKAAMSGLFPHARIRANKTHAEVLSEVYYIRHVRSVCIGQNYTVKTAVSFDALNKICYLERNAISTQRT